MPAELDATDHDSDSGVLQDVGIARVDGKVLGCGDRFST